MDAAGQAALDHASSPQELLLQAQNLVVQLHRPLGISPGDLQLIQERLQQIQRLPQAWDVARGLLDDADPDTKFFGALTFIVKVNQSWPDLSDESVQQLKAHLISRFVALVDAQERQHVIRKLASVLVAVFFKDESWSRPLRDIAASWINGPEGHSEVDFETVLPALNEAQITGLLSLSVTIAEEAVKNSSLVRESGDHPVTESIGDAFCLCDYVLGVLLNQLSVGGDISNTKAGSDALDSCRAWLKVRTSLYFRNRTESESDHIQSSVDRLIQCISIPTLSRNATDVLSDMLRNDSRLLKQPHREYILGYIDSDQGAKLVQHLQEGDYDDDAMAFWELIDAYTSTTKAGLVSGNLGPSHAVLLRYLDMLFQGPGYPGVDDIISPRLLEWWTEAADHLQSGVGRGLQEARQSVAGAVLNVYRRLKWPAREDYIEWDADERSKFSNFRHDTVDFLLAVYPTLGTDLIELFRQKAVSALEMRAWDELESASFCLAQLSQAVDDNDDALAHLNAIFTLDRFTEICLDSDQLPGRTRKTLVDMLGEYQSYFARNPSLLPQVLTFLFSSLNVGACTTPASRSVGSLCKSCRQALVSELPVFLKICSEFQQSKAVTVQSLERVVEGIAAVVQALPSDAEKAPYIDELLKPFFAQSATAREDAQRGDVESAHSRGHLALRCIAGIGRGLWSEEQVIDLESEETPSDDNSFWDGHAIQEQLSQCLLVYLNNSFPLDHTIIEGICEVLRAGFTETTGPFVLRPAIIAHFLTTIPLGTAAGAADVMMSTASSFLASHQSNPAKVREEAALLFIHVYWAFSLMLQNPETHDPEVSNSAIAFLTRSLPKYHAILFTLTSAPPSSTEAAAPVLQTILNFVIGALGGREPLPLRSAAQFWVGVLALPAATNMSRAIIHEYLPSLCHVLMTQLSGSCARSDINHLCEVLKKIIFKFQGEARPHLAASLAALAGPNEQQASSSPTSSLSKEKERFLAMVAGARGGAATQEVVRSYWVSCRGAGFAYT